MARLMLIKCAFDIVFQPLTIFQNNRMCHNKNALARSLSLSLSVCPVHFERVNNEKGVDLENRLRLGITCVPRVIININCIDDGKRRYANCKFWPFHMNIPEIRAACDIWKFQIKRTRSHFALGSFSSHFAPGFYPFYS